MKMSYSCLPCLVNQVVKVADMTKAENQEDLYRKVFSYLSTIDFDKTDPEIVGETFAMVKAHIGNDDPYYDIRRYYNQLFLDKIEEFEEKINQSEDSFTEAIKYAIIGNIIDFNPIHNSDIKDIMKWFARMDEYADILSNGDQSLGTVLERTSEEFRQVYEQADIVIAKGQANYECLSEQIGKNIYFLLMAKCFVIANDIGVPEKSIICKKINL